MRITITALGSRGDVQPCIALGAALKRSGHAVRILANDDFEAQSRQQGLDFSPLGININKVLDTEAARALLETGNNTIRAVRDTVGMVRPKMAQIMARTWTACQDADAIIYSTLSVGAYHAAEKLGVPCFWAMPFPVCIPTRAFPSLLFPLHLPLGGGYNRLTHFITQQFAQGLLRGFFNQWRREHLNLPPTPHRWPYSHLRGQPVPVLYGFSPAALPKPPDWGEHIHVTGCWFLDHPPGWQAPAALVDFLADGPPPVYVGFGSMNNRDPEATTQLIVSALTRAKQRGILLTGEGGLGQANLPDDIFVAQSIPHGWLFPKVAAVVHHGGAGTTGAGLRAGVPSVIVPFFGDQSFWGKRVKALGVGPEPTPRKQLTADKLAYAIRLATEHKPMRARAAALGERIRAKNGVENAVRIIEQYTGSR